MTLSKPTLTTALVLFLLSGCSAHSPFILKNSVDVLPVAALGLEPHSKKVFVTRSRLDADTYEIVARIDIGRIWYGSSSNIMQSMATRARELGADAVVELSTWRQPSGFSWSAPHGSGKAVKFKSDTKPDLSEVPGDWL